MDLDNLEIMNTLDSAQMINSIQTLPEQIRDAWDIGEKIRLPEMAGISQIIIGAIGSSLISARLLQSYLSQTCLIPIHVLSDCDFPAWVIHNKNTLLFISAYEGNERELLSMFARGMDLEFQVVVLTKGGRLLELAQNKQIPLVTFSHIGPARTALAYEFFLPLAILKKVGIISDQWDEVSATINLLCRTRKQIDIQVPVVQNPAKRMAGQFLNRSVTLLASGFMEIVAERWKSQIHENAKAWAQVENIPLICHSTMAGIFNPEDQLAQMMTLFLESDCDHPDNLAISDEARRMFMVEGFNTDVYRTPGAAVLECMWNAIQYGDYISYYLALAYGVDPTPVPGIEEIEYFLEQLPLKDC